MSQHTSDAIRVPLSKSHRVALIDPADAVIIVQYRWYRSTHGYAVTFIPHPYGGHTDRRYPVGMHRILMGMEIGDGLEVDHINMDRLDNRRCNLRITTRAQNDQNRPNGRPSTSSKYRNVDWSKDRWRACITVNGKQVNLGRYDDELEAARAAEAGRRAHMPFAVPVSELEPTGPCCCKSCQPGIDRRRLKITELQRAEIASWPEADSHETVAELFGISKSYVRGLRQGTI